MVCICNVVDVDGEVFSLSPYDSLEFYEAGLEEIQKEFEEEDDIPW